MYISKEQYEKDRKWIIDNVEDEALKQLLLEETEIEYRIQPQREEASDEV